MTATDVHPGLRFVVYGKPATKGSLKPRRVRRRDGTTVLRLTESHESAAPWREAVKYAARNEMAVRARSGEPFTPLAGGVHLEVVFEFAPPKRTGRGWLPWPITRSSGDIDKLQRNVLDALQDAGVYADDAQVVRVVAEKAFLGQPPSALTVPGARILIRPASHGARFR